MCFHASLTKEEKEIQERFKVAAEAIDVYNPYYHFNGYDNKFLYIIKQNEYDLYSPSYWGIMPDNHNIYQRAGYLKRVNTLNARAETLLTKDSFRNATLNNRCLIIADGFFEYHTINNSSFPHYIRYKNNDIFVFAGIYNELDDDIYTASIITTKANDFFKKIHNKPSKHGDHRMPLVLDKTFEWEWLKPNLKENKIKELLKVGFTSEEFTSYPVDKNLFSSNVDTKEVLEPAYYDELNTLF